MPQPPNPFRNRESGSECHRKAGVKVSDSELAKVQPTRHDICGDWNDTIKTAKVNCTSYFCATPRPALQFALGSGGWFSHIEVSHNLGVVSIVGISGRVEGRSCVIRPVGPYSEKSIPILGRASCVKNMVVKSESHETNEKLTLYRDPPLPWLLSAERPIGRVGFAHTGDRRLSRHTGFAGKGRNG